MRMFFLIEKNYMEKFFKWRVDGVDNQLICDKNNFYCHTITIIYNFFKDYDGVWFHRNMKNVYGLKKIKWNQYKTSIIITILKKISLTNRIWVLNYSENKYFESILHFKWNP